MFLQFNSISLSLAGEAGASKTQLCLQLLLTAQLSSQYGGLDASSIYIYTEGDPPLPRLKELAGYFKQRYPPQAFISHPHPNNTVPPPDLMDGIYIEKVSSKIELIQRLQRIEPLLKNNGQGKKRVKLIVIDSVANMYRDLQDVTVTGGAAAGGRGAGELTERSEALFKLSGILRKYADEYQVAVVVVNQAVDCITNNNNNSVQQQHQHVTAGKSLFSKGRQVAPALGLAWANCVNTRVFLSRHNSNNNMVEEEEGPQCVRRSMMIVFSPYLPQWECDYVVEQTGVRGVGNE